MKGKTICEFWLINAKCIKNLRFSWTPIFLMTIYSKTLMYTCTHTHYTWKFQTQKVYSSMKHCSSLYEMEISFTELNNIIVCSVVVVLVFMVSFGMQIHINWIRFSLEFLITIDLCKVPQICLFVWSVCASPPSTHTHKHTHSHLNTTNIYIFHLRVLWSS